MPESANLTTEALSQGVAWQAAKQWRTIWSNSWPLLGIMGLNFFVGYTDIYVAGLLGSEVQAAVGFISQQYFVLIIFGNALGVGTVALVSQAVGQKRWDQVFDNTRQSILLALGLGGGLSALAFAAAGPIIESFSLPLAVQPFALTYLKIFSLALIPNYMIIMFNAVFRASGKALIPFVIMGGVAVINIAGDFVLVFGWGFLPPLGYAGIATSTALSMLIGFCLCLGFLFQPQWRGIWHGPWRVARSSLLDLAQISWPAAILQLAWNAGSLALYFFLSRLGAESVAAMAAYANGLRVEAIIYLPAFALNMAAAVLVGQSLGAGSPLQARQIGWRMAGVGSLALCVLSAVLYLLAPTLASMLTNQEDVLAETVRYLRLNLLAVPFMTYSVVLGGAMQGAGDTRGVMKVIVMAIWAVRIPLAAVLCFTLDLKVLGVWVAMVASMVLQGLFMILRFARGEWMVARNKGRSQAADAR
jgi:multidrug resistance protein, MATE family